MNRQRIIDIFLQLVTINACSTREKPVADYICKFLSSYGYKIYEDSSGVFTNSNTGNLICKIGDGGDSLLLAHMDTARPTAGLIPIVKDDRIISEGDTILGADNRAGIAVLLYLLEKICKDEIKTKNFTIAFTTCEETTLMGSKKLGINGSIQKAFVFDSAFRPGNFIYSSCGSLGFKLSVNGIASHSALAPEKGINSILITARALSKIKQGRIDNETTVNIGRITGGSAVNVIPEKTIIEGEIRSFQTKKVEGLFEGIKSIFIDEAKSLNANCEFEYDWDFEPYNVNSNSEIYKETLNVLNKVGLKPVPKTSLSGSDANSLNANGIEAVNLGIGAQNPHSNDEFILIEDLVKSAEIALELVKP